MNSVTIIGNLTRDPELTISHNGTQICKFNIGVNYKKGDREEADFFNCVAFGKTAESLVKYNQKGSKVLLAGRLHQNRWTKDDKNFSRVEVIATGITFLTFKNNTGNAESTTIGEYLASDDPTNSQSGEIPF